MNTTAICYNMDLKGIYMEMLKGRTAVITGATRGIGRAIAMEMAANGANIAAVYYGSDDLAEVLCRDAQALNVNARAYKCDVSNFEEAKRICGQIILDFGRADILVNNAGIIRDNLLLRMSEEDFDAVIDVNLKGAFNFIKHLSRPVMKSPAGRIINITSVSGLAGNPGQANYSSAKAGMIGLTKTAAKELAPRNVTCNAIAPGFIETDMTSGLPDSIKESINAAIPLKRMGNASDIARLAVFLASDFSSYITGEVIRVDGGMQM